MADTEGLIGLLEEAGSRSLTVVSAPAPEPSGEVYQIEVRPEDEWADDPVSAKWDKIRKVFLNGKTPAEIMVAAADMPTNQWLEMAMRMAPKDVKVSAEFNFKHLVEELGPIDKSKYRIVEAEYEEV